MNPILAAAQMTAGTTVKRKAWASRGDTKVHLWELESGGVLMLQHVKGEGFKQPVILESEMEVVVDRFRHKRGQRIFSPQGA